MSELDAHEAETVVQLIRVGNDAGEFDCPDPVAAAARLTALRDGLAIDRTLFHPATTSEQLSDQMRGAIRNNLGLSRDAYAAAVAARPERP